MDKKRNSEKWYVQKNLRAISVFFRHQTRCFMKTSFQTTKLGLKEK